MKTVELLRVETGSSGTFGALKVDKQVTCWTLEPPFAGNAPNISCIPTGQYWCRYTKSPRFGLVFEVSNVPGRSNILFHTGNTTHDTSGCILPGERLGDLNGERAVLGSRTAYGKFLAALEKVNGFHLTIKEAY